MKQFSHFLLLLASAAFASTLMGCAAPNQSPNETPAGEGGESENSKSSQVRTWRNVTFVSSQALQDDDTWVGGDTDGSSFLVVREKIYKETTWVFLNGHYMSLRLPGVRPEIITYTPGVGITSKTGDWSVKAASPFDKRELSHYLQHLYQAFQVLHVPFLTGEGWPVTLRGTNGADADRAEEILARMRLNMRRIGSNQTGKVLKQVPAGGEPVPVGTTVRVWLDGSAFMGSRTPGDTFKTPIPIDQQGTARGMISEDYQDTLPKASCDLSAEGKDIFWKLPESAESKTVTATLLGLGKRVTISAWKGDPDPNNAPTPIGCDGNSECCAYGRNPTITFLADASEVTFIVIDVNPADLEEEPLFLKMKVSW